MDIHVVQHVPFENEAFIGQWAENRGQSISRTLMFREQTLPDLNSFDLLIIMGGPMGVHEETKYPWLRIEKEFISQAIKKNKYIIGICLGAQLIAEVLGSSVRQNLEQEIGWFPVYKTKGSKSMISRILPDEFIAFHWHGDTFDIPDGAVQLALSEACINQAFEYSDRIFALQFHIESTETSIEELICNCGQQLIKRRFVQTTGEIKENYHHINRTNKIMGKILDYIESKQLTEIK